MSDHEDRAARVVADRAAEWFIRLKDRDLSMSERRKFVRWLKQSPGNIAEFMRLAQLYGRVKRANVPTPPPDEVPASENVIALGPREFQPPLQPLAGFFDSRKARFAAVAAGLALVAVIGVIANFVLSSNTIETHLGEWRKVQLADGTQVSVGANTRLEVDYSAGVRRIQLERGEAMFSVTKDPSRPFIVYAGGAVVRAVGTRFGVDRRADSVQITVAEGKVAVVRGDQAAALEKAVDMRIAIPLTQDQRVEIKVNAPSVTPLVETVNSTSALAWANGQLVFQNATLGEAVQEFNRRNQIQIEVDDPTVASWHVCCVFDAADPEAFAKLIAMDDTIDLERHGPNTLRLVPQAPGQAGAPVKDNPI